MTVKEIGQAEVSHPDGYVGNLTDEQDQKLRQAWKQYFDILAKAKGGGKGGEGGGGGDGGEEYSDDPKKSGIAKDDKAKEEAKAKEEQKAMDELTDQYGQEALKDAFWKFIKLDDPDTCILRFLRARKWDVGRGMAMLAGCMKWRLDNGIEDLALGGDEGNAKIEKFLEQQRSGKTYAFGAAKNECPCCYIHVRKHFTKGQPAESMQKYVAYAMESFRLLLVPPNDKVVLFFDLNKFGLSNMDWGCILYIVKCLEAYFPESLHTLVVYKAPWIFSGIWKVLGPLLDPTVRSKVVFMSKPEECAHLLPADRLIAELGGDVDFDFTKAWKEPRDGENKVDEQEKKKREEAFQKIADEYEEVTKKWADGDSSKELLDKRLILVKKLRVAQFEKEPFTRGRTQLHRDATIDGQGIVTWMYKQKDGEAIRHIVGRKFCAAVLKRELKEIEEEGSSIKDAEKKTDEALEKEDWVTLYGSEEMARNIEGERVDGKTPEEGETSPGAITVVGVPAGTLAGPAEGKTLTATDGGDGAQANGDSGDKKESKKDSKKDDKKDDKKDSKKEKEEAAAGAGAGAAAGGAAAAAASSGGDDAGKDEFHEAPVADSKTVQKAESRDHIAVPHDEKAAKAANGHPQNGDAAPAGEGAEAKKDTSKSNGNSASDYGKLNGSGTNVKDKMKENLVDKPKEKGSSLGRRLSKMMSKN